MLYILVALGTFRGEDVAIPAGFGLCTKCGALLELEQWLEESCLGRISEAGLEEAHSDEV